MTMTVIMMMKVWVSAVVTVAQVVVWDKDGAFVEPDVIPVIVKFNFGES